MGLRPAAFVPLLVGALIAADISAAAAQVLRGRITDQGTGEAIQGAFVSLVDEGGERRSSTLTGADGAFILRAPEPGTYRLRSERIGFETVTTDPYTLDDGETVRRDLSVLSAAVELEGISVSAERQCDAHPAEGGAMARLWDEVQKAVAVAEWVEESGVLRYRIRRYARILDAEDMSVRQESSRQRSGYAEQPFVAPAEESLLERGYVQERDGEVYYYAPDVRTLLSDGFTRTHCFGVVQPEDEAHAGRVGLSFTPVDSRDVPDIRGTLWVDEASAELQRLEFSYTALDGVRRSRRLGGHVDFRRLDTGAWIVGDWSIRMPVVGRQQQRWLESSGGQREVLVGIREVGGEVMDLTTVESDLDLDIAGERGSLTGIVWDSVRAEPVPDARVFLSGTGHYTRTDAEGRFTLPGVPAGTYPLAFYHERMGERDLTVSPREVEVTAGQVDEVRLALPSETTMAVRACTAARDPGEDAPGPDAILAGTVLDALTLGAVAGAPVRAEWPAEAVEAGAGPRRAETETDERGRYRFCGLPSGVRASVRVDFLDRSASDDVRLSADEPAIRNLRLALTEPADVEVEVLERETGSPLEGAAVSLGGSAEAGTSDHRGRVGFSSVPPGYRALRVEHPSFGTATDSALIRAAGFVRLRVRLAPGEDAPEPVEVTVLGDLDRTPERFDPAGAAGGRRTVLTRDEIRRTAPRGAGVGELLGGAAFPGLRVGEIRIPDAPGRLCVEPNRERRTLRGGCDPVAVFVNDVRPSDPGRLLLELGAGEVERIEYLPPREAAAIYGTGSRNGLLLLYTNSGR